MDTHADINQKPQIGDQQDIAHYQSDKHISTQDVPPTAHIGIPLENETEQRSQYTYKAIDPHVLRNPTVTNPVYMKSFVERKLRHPPKSLPQPTSTTSEVHDWKILQKENKITEVYIPVAIDRNNSMLINRTKPGYSKYLDSSATTTNSSYVEYPLNDLGIGSKDHITFYNWKKEKPNVFQIKETQCDKFPSPNCRNGRVEIRDTVKAVPHGGYLSEFSSAYCVARERFLLDLSPIKTELVKCDIPPLKFESSNSIYGKGERTEAFI